ncbi:MAG: hypothetical protein KDA85_10050 [Planctomycetaceae bacterium]|nr:hypothetical protein [Planctomycetaceae bacterium]
MFRIAPPQREFRWIPGSAVVPVDERLRLQHNNDPYAVPSNVTQRTTPGNNPQTAAIGGVTEVPPVNVPRTSRMVQLQNLRTEREQLADIDRRFREMLLHDPSQWDLNGIETSYRNLQKSVTHKPLAGQIELRYPAIERYRQRKAQFDDFKRLTSETERRDAELLASGNSPFPGGGMLAGFSAGPEQFTVGSPAPQLSENVLFGDDSAMFAQTPADAADDSFSPLIPAESSGPFSGWADNGVASAAPSSPATGISPGTAGSTLAGGTRVDGRTRYVGAGVIQRAPGEAESGDYVLMTPSGRVLAHVKGTGDVSLEEYVGHSVGVHGRRYFKSDINSDYIEISGLETVKLQ